MKKNKLGERENAVNSGEEKSKNLQKSFKKLISGKFSTQRECAKKMGISEQQLSKSMKKPTAKFIAKLEKALDTKLTIINGTDVQIIQGDRNNQHKTTKPGSSKDLVELYKSIIIDKDNVIEDLKLIIRSLKETRGN